MKNTLYCLLLLPFFSQAQISPCAQAKMHGRSHQRSSVASPAHTNLESRYDVHYYKLDVDVEITGKSISGNVTINASAVATVDTFALELHPNFTVDSALVNGSTVTTYHNINDLGLLLPATVNTGGNMVVQVYYHGTSPTDSTGVFGDGFSNDVSPSWGNHVTWSLTQPYAGHQWWPCKQDLTDKADSSAVNITTDSANMAGSNGLLKNVVNLPNHKRRFEWVNNHVIDYYLISVSVAKYIDHSIYAHPAGADSILFQNFIYDNPQTLQNFRTVLDSTVQIIEQFSNYFGLYPFHDQKYGHCMAPISGGMEHQTMTTQGFFDFTIDAHELCHQWFGDYVTCATWADIWLNEGFASYGEYMSQEIFNPVNKAPYMLDFHNQVMAQPDGSVYCTDTNSVSRIFDSRLSYAKGAAVIHTLRYLINNDSVFFASLRTYLAQHGNNVATTDQFHASIQQSTGVSLDSFFTQWVYGQGYPAFNVKWKQVADTLYLQNTETTSASNVTPLFTLPVEYKITTAQGDTTYKLMQNANLKQFALHVNAQVAGVAVDPNNWIVNAESVQNDTTFTYTAVQEVASSAFQIYPNPVHNELVLQVNGLNGSTQAQIFDADGKLLLQTTISNSTNRIDVKTLAAGVYLLKADGQVLKFVKQ